MTDLEVVGSLQPDQVEAYLGSKKWKKYSTADFYSVWTSEDDEYEAVVPQVGSPDYGRQLLNTLRELEKNAFNFDLKEKNLKDLEGIEKRVNNIRVSMMDSKELYDLKGHVGEVRARLLHLYS